MPLKHFMSVPSSISASCLAADERTGFTDAEKGVILYVYFSRSSANDGNGNGAMLYIR
jgi:hypothetical protein